MKSSMPTVTVRSRLGGVGQIEELRVELVLRSCRASGASGFWCRSVGRHGGWGRGHSTGSGGPRQTDSAQGPGFRKSQENRRPRNLGLISRVLRKLARSALTTHGSLASMASGKLVTCPSCGFAKNPPGLGPLWVLRRQDRGARQRPRQSREEELERRYQQEGVSVQWLFIAIARARRAHRRARLRPARGSSRSSTSRAATG